MPAGLFKAELADPFLYMLHSLRGAAQEACGTYHAQGH